MFDIERAKKQGATEKQLAILERVNANTRRRESCSRHDFELIKGSCKYRCKNCGCVEDVSFVTGYKQGLKHHADLESLLSL